MHNLDFHHKTTKNFSKTLLLSLLLTLTVACSDKTQLKDEKPRTVLVTEVGGTGSNTDRVYAGRLIASERATLSFETSGVISALNVDLGDKFQLGDALATIDDTRLQISLRSGRADVASARATLEDARLEYERKEKVREAGAISQLDLDQAKAKFDSAVAREESAVAALAGIEQQILDLTLTAPFSGEVVDRFVEPSQVIRAGEAVFEVVGLDLGFEGIINVPVTTRQSLAVGDSVILRVAPTFSDNEATIIEIGNRANQAGLFPITVKPTSTLTNANAGQSIEVSVSNNSSESLHIPVTAYAMSANGQPFVFVIENNALKKEFVELGEISNKGAEVLSGLVEGTMIVTKGVDLLSDGQQVIVIEDTQRRFGN